MKDIKGFENKYKVTIDGKIWSCQAGKYMKTYITVSGYEIVNLYKDKKSKSYRVHRLVAQTFIPNINNKPCVNHLDGNKLNNHKDNLEWVTSQENTDHAKANGLFKVAVGEKSGPSKLRETDVLIIRQKYKEGQTIYSLSKKYGLVHNCIKSIVTGRTWKHLPI